MSILCLIIRYSDCFVKKKKNLSKIKQVHCISDKWMYLKLPYLIFQTDQCVLHLLSWGCELHSLCWWRKLKFCSVCFPPGIILCMYPANERWHYTVTPSLIGCAHTQNDPGVQSSVLDLCVFTLQVWRFVACPMWSCIQRSPPSTATQRFPWCTSASHWMVKSGRTTSPSTGQPQGAGDVFCLSLRSC